jgi:hypothetical protein
MTANGSTEPPRCPNCGQELPGLYGANTLPYWINTPVYPIVPPCQHCYCQRVEATTASPAGVRCCKCFDVRHTGMMP